MASLPDWKRVLDDPDEETAQLIIGLQIEDVEAGLQDAGEGSDDRVALSTYDAELRQYQAVRRYEGEETPLAQVSVVAASEVTTSTTSSASGEAADDHEPKQKSSAPAKLTGVPLFRCEACRDQFPTDDVWQNECEHYYCTDCLGNLFIATTSDESLYPPRCCHKVMPYDEIKILLPADVTEKFDASREELENKDRTYCHEPTCSAYISIKDREDDVATCPKCDRKTCITCKGASYDGDCPQDEALQGVLKVAGDEGWQRCPVCRTMIELDHGCNHMTCKCRAEFCYVCAATWKTCPCEQWQEERLIARAQDIVNRGPVAGNGQAQQAAVAAAAQHLRDHHECDHEHWRRTGRGQCEECRDYLHVFLLECTQCGIQACRRCADNRL